MDRRLLLQAAASWFMCGLCWLCQIAHYPMMAKVGDLAVYEQGNVPRTASVVIVPIAIEAALAAWLVARPSRGVSRAVAASGFALVAAIWIASLTCEYPAQMRLSQGSNTGDLDFLIATNWIRTIGWTMRGALSLWMIEASEASKN